MADEFQKWAIALQSRLTAAESFQQVLPDIEQVIRTSIEDNFRMGGRYGNDNPWGGGSQRWDPVKHPDSTKRVLVDTTDMLNSIDVRVEIVGGQIQVLLISRPSYSLFHMEGTRFMPARPFLVLQNEDVEDIIQILMEGAV